uniref:Uncharacterized protein n=1 Tax=Candidatus Nitrotoga fabula TaxID=2182327 RepID=A0A2X0QXI2_9PROT|nr:protein of unknown function [Candidatus Nitrotoga fabula]
MLPQISDCRGNSNTYTMVASHGINGNRDIHQAILKLTPYSDLETRINLDSYIHTNLADTSLMQAL